jgi:transposase InsO family protein
MSSCTRLSQQIAFSSSSLYLISFYFSFYVFLISYSSITDHFDRDVVKLLNPYKKSHSTVPLSPKSSPSLSFAPSSFYLNSFACTTPTRRLDSPTSIPVRDDMKLPQHFYFFEDFLDFLDFSRSFYANSDADEDEIGQWCLGAYKRVDRKVKPVPGVYPEEARVQRTIPKDPLKSLIPLTPHPPEFIPTKKLSQSRVALMKVNSNGFLWPEEEKLFIHIMKLNEKALAFDESERGSFRDDYFTPYIIPILPHEPWEYRNIPIPPGIRERVIQLLKDKIATGLYEPSQSSYRSKWFCVMKKTGKIRIVHDLQPLNKVTIRDAGVPPILDDFVEPFAGRQCYTVFDLFSGFDARRLHPDSRDLTSFMTPLGLLRHTAMPQGFTNSPSEFQNCTSFILQDEIPHVANVFIDDLPIKGPPTRYEDSDGHPETLSSNPGIRRFIWEHAVDVHRVMHRFACAGGTFAGPKSQICQPRVTILGQDCHPDGRSPQEAKVLKILNWPTLATPKDVRSFLGLCGTVRIWIANYSQIARPLIELYRKDAPFIWDERRQDAFDALKHAITHAPALSPIDYTSDSPIILSVDTSKIAIGFILSQLDAQGRKCPARYGSLPINERESNYSQPKLELYGLFRALRHYRLFLYGVKHLWIEVDAKYIKGMLNEPDLQPNATINRWIEGVLMFDFTLIHVPAARHLGPDALSRRQPTEEEYEEGSLDAEDADDWIESLYITSHSIPYDFYMLPSFHSNAASQDRTLRHIIHFLRTMQLPPLPSITSRKRFIRKTLQFFLKANQLFKRRGSNPPSKVILDPELRSRILSQAHEELGHRGVHGVFQTVKERFYWPYLFQDVAHHVRSCHQCQIRSTRKVEIPLTISASPTIFTKLYVDVMLMPKARGFRYLVAARDDLSLAAEGRALRHATSDTLAKFFWEEIICRYGAIAQVVTDNGSEVKGAFEKLMKRYSLPQIRISPYNSKANGVVERGHFIIREAILKSCNEDISLWPTKVHHAFFADKVITRRSTGFSPYFLLHGIDPVLPFDLFESTYLVEGFQSSMTTEELLALRIRQLEKRPDDIHAAFETLHQSRLRSKKQFEKRYASRLVKTSYNSGDLVLVRNTQVEKELDRKSKPRYLGPFEVVRQTKGGSYVLKEMDGTISRRGIAAFRLIPYFPRHTPLPSTLFHDDEEDNSDDEEDNNIYASDDDSS